jgi:hypothetical protein
MQSQNRSVIKAIERRMDRCIAVLGISHKGDAIKIDNEELYENIK